MFSKLFRSIFTSRAARRWVAPRYSEQLIRLDAENLAEQGILEAYQRILPNLKRYLPEPLPLIEYIDADKGSYSVGVGDAQHVIYSPDLPGTEADGWGRATFFLFRIVNDQLRSSPVRFYALNGGNDLAGIFLTADEAAAMRAACGCKQDRPYFPALVSPWFGMEHECPHETAAVVGVQPPTNPGSSKPGSI